MEDVITIFVVDRRKLFQLCKFVNKTEPNVLAQVWRLENLQNLKKVEGT